MADRRTGDREKDDVNDNSMLNRRSYLTAAAAAAATVVGGAGAASAQSNYEVIEVSEGEKRIYDLDDGETFENVLIDQTAADASFSLRANGDYTIRNVGWRGIGTRERASYHIFGGTSGEGLIENVYMSNKGSNPDDASSMGGIWTGRYHGGHVTIRNTYIEGMGDNAAYCSSGGWQDGNRGTAEFEYCFHRDNTVSQYRIGVTGSEVRNCVGIVNDPEGYRGTYRPHNPAQGGRCVWARDGGDVHVRDSSFYLDPDDTNPIAVFAASTYDGSYADTNLYVENCDVNEDNPQLTLSGGDRPDDSYVHTDGVGHQPSMDVLSEGGGVPTSPEMAASGEREIPDPPEIGSGDSGNGSERSGIPEDRRDEAHEVAFVAGPDRGSQFYEFAGSGVIEFADLGESPHGGSIQGGSWTTRDAIDRGDETWEATGGTGNGHGDGYLLLGSVQEVPAVDDGLTIYLDGEEVTTDELVQRTSEGGGDGLPNTLAIDGTESDAVSYYTFTVSGDVEVDEEQTTVVDGGLSWDSVETRIEGGEVVGIIGRGRDCFRYSGELTDITVYGDAVTQLDPSE